MNDRPSLKSMTKSRFRGTLLGGAMGDALGFPFEGATRSFMRALGNRLLQGYERHRSGYFAAGQFSDDTQMTLATVESILKHGELDGEAVANAFVPLWRENRIVGRGEACTESMERLMSGEAQWHDSGAEAGRAGNGVAMRSAPIGLWLYDNQEEIPRWASSLGGITHRDRRAQAGGAAVAAAVAYNVTHRETVLGDFVDTVADAARGLDSSFATFLEEIPRLLSIPEADALEEISILGVETVTPENREGITAFVLPTVVMSLYSFLRSPNSFAETVQRCLLAGGDVDTTAAIAGGVSGAMVGEEGLLSELLDQLPGAVQIRKLADRLHSQKEARRAVS